MNLLELYQEFSAGGEAGKNARNLLAQTHWFLVHSELDPKTSEALPQSLSVFLAKVARPKTVGEVHRDRLWRITEHSRSAIERLFRTLNESPRREQALLPVHMVRELDASSFIKLSNRPGRNIREKLAGKPYLQAVRRYQSVNLPENRLLKAFVTRLVELLELRRDLLGEKEDALLSKIQSWLCSDEASTIAKWDNLPPNNTLLAHRDYRRVWDAWRWLQALDDDIARDFSLLQARAETVKTWDKPAQMWADGSHLFTDIPVFFDFEKFEIRPWNKPMKFQRSVQRFSRKYITPEISEPVCVDLSVLRPYFATSTNKIKSLRETYAWQQWKNTTESVVDIDLFNSDAIYLHSEATTITSPDLFFATDKSSECFDRAARSFATKLQSVFKKNEAFIWLVPDVLNDFEIEVFRRNLNARFQKAEPLPRSVAAAIEQVDYSKLKGDRFPIVVIDTVDGKTSVTKLIATFDKKLNEVLPETNGYYWERCPSVIIESTTDNQKNYDSVTVDDKGQWCDAIKSEKPPFIDPHTLKNDSRIGTFAFCINLAKSPVNGGIQLHSLQQRAGDIPLWRDQIPELSIKVMKDGYYQKFHLVSLGTTIKPIRGLPVRIPITENFILPAEKRFYEFPLFQGGNADDFGYSARLDSPVFFPLKENAICKLILTFEYGADEPYKLVFAPLDKSFPPIRSAWKKTETEIITDAPAPAYPEPMSWNSLKNWKDAQGNQVDLLKWLIDSLSKLCDLVPIRSSITISSSWKIKNGSNGTYWFTFAKTENGEDCYCNTKNFSKDFEGNPNSIFPVGMQLFCNIRKKDNTNSAYDISTEINAMLSIEIEKRIITFKERSIKNRMSLIWSDSRTLQDVDCPIHFKTEFAKLNNLLFDKLPQKIIEKKILFLHACMHKDAPSAFVEWISKQSSKKTISDPPVIGFALGGVSELWQKEVLSNLLSNRTFDTLRVFAYAIWREQHFVEHFNYLQLHGIANGLLAMLREITPCPPRHDDKDKRTIRNWIRSTAEPLELVLGLLRSRTSSNNEIKMLLQPHQKITKELAKQVERIAEMLAKSKINLFSRVQIKLPKPEGDRTPDLLYALRLYLTGDDGANAIHITGVSDNDVDSN